MRPSRSSGTCSAMSGGIHSAMRAFHPRPTADPGQRPRSGPCRNGAPRRARRARAGDPSADASRSLPQRSGPTRKVVREAGHFVAVAPRVDEQHAGPALHDNGVALAELALVDQHTLRDLPQHGCSFPADGLHEIAGDVLRAPQHDRLAAVDVGGGQRGEVTIAAVLAQQRRSLPQPGQRVWAIRDVRTKRLRV
jgi:hypothetical protein